MAIAFNKPGSSLAELNAAWPDRLKDAEALLAAGRHGFALATALYALEIRLKVLICVRLELDHLPRAFEIHELDQLLVLAGLSRRVERKPARNVKRNWDQIRLMEAHLNEFRYRADANWTATQVQNMLHQLCNPKNGVITWLGKVR
ncbi:Uncharacterized protein OS=Beggiatoa sp. PS GN=BGP_6287 PE=4 SV=1 [Gemmataceae bacterium]|nr:Uncharacterized protein OS=Beggiatoa sp. PS GN=BGP_6287 PE=4 SV=1 [Gemmataceae bacterium]VTT99872.1 Uncharacterized protein OS=Beggiatoa sp. PS GN=BGP_6287 PE=4 SV=1 [Gemmataceae bacterium]